MKYTHIGPAKTTNNRSGTMNCCGGPGAKVKAAKAVRGKKQPREPLPSGGAQSGAIVGNVGSVNFLAAQTKNMMMKVHEHILAGVLKLDTKVSKKKVVEGRVGLTAMVTGVSTRTVRCHVRDMNPRCVHPDVYTSEVYTSGCTHLGFMSGT